MEDCTNDSLQLHISYRNEPCRDEVGYANRNSNMDKTDGVYLGGKGGKRPGNLSEAGSNFGSAAKDNDIVLGLIGDLPMK